MKKRKDSSFPTKKCIRKPYRLPKADSEVSSNGSAKLRLLSITRQCLASKHKSPGVMDKRTLMKKNVDQKQKHKVLSFVGVLFALMSCDFLNHHIE